MQLVLFYADDDDLGDLMAAMAPAASKWNLIGTAFRLKSDRLDQIGAACPGSPEECLLKVFREWLHRNYNVGRFGEPSWVKVVGVMASPAGGNNYAQAKSIASEHQRESFSLDKLIGIDLSFVCSGTMPSESPGNKGKVSSLA